ncbi:hypothetical protein QBC35DRAFT_395880 [Podospora australis]|uniref:Uncharacterized protein n=1 Tax=Podospora australis TaxID=1536484 RepID=A0AAN6WI25_9PEZI|nr:hypothetical protein QBC35DRAFT_395880 [Podospora australis]
MVVLFIHTITSSLDLNSYLASRLCSRPPERSESFGRQRLRKFQAPKANSRHDASLHDDPDGLLGEARLTLNDGFLRLREPSGRVGFYGVSMYHQLHCIDMLRIHITGQGSHDHSHEASNARREGQGIPQGGHLIHCLDYLSQAVMCAADDTIEPARVKIEDGKNIASIDGAEAMHYCRDSKAVARAVALSETRPFVLGVSGLADGETVTSLVRTAGRGLEGDR